jgi:seryl-tRNA synthetase
MLDPAFVRDHSTRCAGACAAAGIDPDAELEQLASLEAQRRRLIPQVEGLKREQNAAGDEVARAKREGKTRRHLRRQQAARPADQAARAGTRPGIERSARPAETLPNLPHASVPVGARRRQRGGARVGEPRAFDFEPKAHWDLGPALGIIDFERAAPRCRARASRC